MKILFDQGVPAPLKDYLVDHDVTTAYEQGWSRIRNGELLRLADARFDSLVTTDQGLKYQQNLSGMKIAILVLPTTSWPRIQANIAEVVAALGGLQSGQLMEIQFHDA